MTVTTSISSIYPWHAAPWQLLQQRAREGNLAHALLFAGPAGIGKAALADRLARSLLCSTPAADGTACGNCPSCRLLAAGTHPDYLRIEPEEEGKAIPVDRIRGISDFLALKGQYGPRQIVVIQPAEAMNRFAANSLLKTLEEPNAEDLLILVSSRPSQLLPTLRSRCQRVRLTLPDPEQGRQWLEQHLGAGVNHRELLALAHGAPLAAQRLHQSGQLVLREQLAKAWLDLANPGSNPLACAEQWQALDLAQGTAWLSGFIADLVRLKSGAGRDAIVNCDMHHQLQKLSVRLDLQQLFDTLELLTEYARMAGGQLNPQLAMENIMLDWARVSRAKTTAGSRRSI